VLLCGLLISPLPLASGQEPAKPAPGTPAAKEQAEPPGLARRVAPGGLRILVLEGQNVANSLATMTTISPVVQVLDSVDQPVEGATVTFEAPASGPGGTFGGKPIATVRTDYSGQATAEFTPGNAEGTFLIKVTATIGTQRGEARIRQTNDRKAEAAHVMPPPKPWYKNWKWWAVIGAGAGAGAAAGIIFSDRNNTATITIAPGSVVVGGPR
jgi:hypothetical protein